MPVECVGLWENEHTGYTETFQAERHPAHGNWRWKRIGRGVPEGRREARRAAMATGLFAHHVIHGAPVQLNDLANLPVTDELLAIRAELVLRGI